MAKQLRVDEKCEAATLFDQHTGKNCRIEKLVDVTKDCPRASDENRSVFLYARLSRGGRTVQMIRLFKGDELNMGMFIWFFVDQLEQVMHAVPRDDTFGLWAKELGLSKPELRSLIETHAPAA